MAWTVASVISGISSPLSTVGAFEAVGASLVAAALLWASAFFSASLRFLLSFLLSFGCASAFGF
jgi:hypothetical protein